MLRTHTYDDIISSMMIYPRIKINCKINTENQYTIDALS